MEKAQQTKSIILHNRLYQPGSSTSRERRILVLKTGIAGVQFHIKNEEERDALRNLKPGDELMLYRDSDNKHDKWAIGVYRTEEDMIGYITRFKNETIARLMDAGKKFVAVIDPDDEEDADSFDENIHGKTRYAPTENMAVPFSVYLIEGE